LNTLVPASVTAEFHAAQTGESRQVRQAGVGDAVAFVELDLLMVGNKA